MVLNIFFYRKRPKQTNPSSDVKHTLKTFIIILEKTQKCNIEEQNSRVKWKFGKNARS